MWGVCQQRGFGNKATVGEELVGVRRLSYAPTSLRVRRGVRGMGIGRDTRGMVKVRGGVRRRVCAPVGR